MKTYIFHLILITFFITGISCGQKKELEKTEELEYFGKITAPDFPQGAEWLNTDNPVSLKDLRGKLVLLDFWTYCCINCMHIIPDLKKLEAKYPNELVVIGVHSAKFLTERGTENIRQAILRYEIEHPVINDKDFEVWNSYTANAWPTLVLIDPRGKIIQSTSGEGVYEIFDPIISSAIAVYDRLGGVLNREPVKFTLEKSKVTSSLLNYPGKVTADVKTSRLFITDSNNNRILILKINDAGDEATVEEVIGSGKPGQKDGSYKDTEFFHPQGIAYHNDKLYVADTENHLLREIDLLTKQVQTIAGTGRQTQTWASGNGKALETALNSPWDLVVLNDVIYIAMAGSHQLWKMDLTSGTIGPYAGSGREDIIDGDFNTCALAQPSGITTDGRKLYFADSEVSAVRSADLSSDGKISTIVGQGLFEFGDIDGSGSKVRLQHPLGIAYNSADGLLYIADTYNNKIKIINPKTKEARLYSGTGTAGDKNGEFGAQFSEPGGLTIMNGKIFITDTNNHLLRVIDMNTKEVRTVKILNPETLTITMNRDKKRNENAVKVAPVNLKTGDIKLSFSFVLPAGYKINPDAKPQVAVSSRENLVEAVETEIDTKSPNFELPLKINGSAGKLDIEVLIYYCKEDNEGLCKFKDVFFEVPVNTSANGENEVSLIYSLN